jgi:hypothetical protein
MEESVDQWCKGNADHDDEHETAEKRVDGREQFTIESMELVYRPHPAKNHGSIDDGVNPRLMLKSMISGDADSQCAEDEQQDYGKMADDAKNKFADG